MYRIIMCYNISQNKSICVIDKLEIWFCVLLLICFIEPSFVTYCLMMRFFDNSFYEIFFHSHTPTTPYLSICLYEELDQNEVTWKDNVNVSAKGNVSMTAKRFSTWFKAIVEDIFSMTFSNFWFCSKSVILQLFIFILNFPLLWFFSR